MRVKKKIAIIAVILGIISTAGAVAYFSDIEIVRNHVSTGIVDIHIEEYEKTDDGIEKPFEDGKKVLPGDTVSKIVYVKNDEAECYIRCKVDFGVEDDLDLSKECLKGIEENWILVGDYYYYIDSVPTDEKIKFFDEIMIPEDWDNRYAGKTFSVEVIAEAVQKKNFTPNYNSENPWGDTPIEECVYSSHNE